MSSEDVRWQQRFANYKKALERLSSAVSLANERELSELEEQGVIKSFEYTHELAWNVMKDYLEYQGSVNLRGSRDAIREAFKFNLVEKGELWMSTLKSRQETVHTYNEPMAKSVLELIKDQYLPIFVDFHDKMETIKSGE